MRLPAIEPESPGKKVSQDREHLRPHREQRAVLGRLFVRPVRPEPDRHGVDAGGEVWWRNRGQWRPGCSPDGGQLADVQALDQELHRHGSRLVTSRRRDPGPATKRFAELTVGPPLGVEAIAGRGVGGPPTGVRRLRLERPRRWPRTIRTIRMIRLIGRWTVVGTRRLDAVGGRVLDQVGRVPIAL